MIKFKMYSKLDVVKELGKNAKRQAKETPLTIASLGIMSISAANNLYNTESSRKARKRTLEELEKLSPRNKNKIILQS
jgi:hypothetical protein